MTTTSHVVTEPPLLGRTVRDGVAADESHREEA